MKIQCFKCSTDYELHGTVGRTSTCSNCQSDIRVCFNCEYYDPSAYNECRESSADRVVEKDRANFCDFFRAGVNSHIKGTQNTGKADTLKKLDDLFKK